MGPDSYITVLYSCAGCGVVDRCVVVRARGDEDVVTWVEQTIQVVGADHSRASPSCRATHLVDLKIPVSGDKVGGVTRH